VTCENGAFSVSEQRDEWIAHLRSAYVVMAEYLRERQAPDEVWQAFEYMWVEGAVVAVDLT
jgi:hypothetical protein